MRDVSTALDAFEQASTADFACRLTLPVDALELAVDGVGDIPLPLSTAQAKALAEVARPAPFGLGKRTLRDPKVRNVGEIARSRVRIDRRRWKRHLTPALEDIRAQLGLPDGTLEARLHKLLVYGKGQFFLPHRDTERDDDMLGTLVVVLPSAHRGGTLVVEHKGEARRFVAPRANAAPALTLLAFYADCLHEVRPVTAGTRVVLSYQLHFTSVTPDAPPRVTHEEGLNALVGAVGGLFDESAKVPVGRFRSDRAEKLVCLLDHEYSSRSLSWSRLKGGDVDRALALRYAALALDLRPWLALVTVDETWDAWEEEYGGGGDDDYELNDLIERGARLEDWLGVGDERPDFPSLHAWESELCRIEVLDGAEPDHQEFEGYTGNYGNTLERSYRRSAIVLWPAREHHRVLLDMGPGTLLRELLRATAGGDEDEIVAARQTVLATLEDWFPHEPSTNGDTFADALALCPRLDDTALAVEILSRFRLVAIEPRSLPALLALGARHGPEFRRALVARWTGTSSPIEKRPSSTSTAESAARPRRHAERFAVSPGQQVAWLGTFATFCEQARDTHDGVWADVLPALFEHLHAQLRAVHAVLHDTRTPSRREAAVDREVAGLVALLEATRALGDPAAGVAVLDALREDLDDYEPDVTVRVVEHLASLSTASRDERVADSLLVLRRRTADVLRAALARSARVDDDWRIDAELDCACEDCQRLASFLGAREQRSLDLPLAAARRGHLHRKIDERELPVSHETRRQGRPYVLQLRKLPALFRQSRHRHAHAQALLTRLEKAGPT